MHACRVLVCALGASRVLSTGGGVLPAKLGDDCSGVGTCRRHIKALLETHVGLCPS